MILHCVAQKQVHNFDPATWKDDLDHAKLCLDILSFCSKADPVAAKHHEKLINIHNNLLSNMDPTAGNGEILAVDIDVIQNQAALFSFPGSFPTSFERGPMDGSYLLTFPPNADPLRVRLSNTLLAMLCQPGGDISTKLFAAEDGGSSSYNDREWIYTAQSDEALDWDSRSRDPLEWDVRNLSDIGDGSNHRSPFESGTMPSGEPPPQEILTLRDADGEFLDSMEPSAWASPGTRSMN